MLRIHEDFVASFRPLPSDDLVVQRFLKEFDFKDFNGELIPGGDFGFDSALKYIGQNGGFLEYWIPTPLCRKVTKEKCGMCDGEGKSEFHDPCIFCDGDGKETGYDYKEAFAVSTSLSTLFDLMSFPELETSSKVPQLMTIQTVTHSGFHGSSLGGEYGKELVDYLRSRTAGRIPEMIAVMKAIHGEMEGRAVEYDSRRFEAYTQGKSGWWLNVSCPGDACGLNPTHDSDDYCGYQFSCHNVDQPMQQFTLLGSLAALHDLARPPQT